MRIRETFRSSFKSLFHNKLRSFLTMLGIIIGIFSVIMLTSIGEGVKHQVTSQVESLGANLLYVFPGKIEIGPQKAVESKLGVRSGGFGQKSTLTYDDVLALKNKKHIAAATAMYGGIDWLDKMRIYVSTTGVDEDFFKINQPDLRWGRFISKKEREKNKSFYRNLKETFVDIRKSCFEVIHNFTSKHNFLDIKKRVAVIGHQANKEIFGGKNSVFPAIQTALSVPAVIIALLFALLVGVFFGVYPATKAAKLDPIEALRNE